MSNVLHGSTDVSAQTSPSFTPSRSAMDRATSSLFTCGEGRYWCGRPAFCTSSNDAFFICSVTPFTPGEILQQNAVLSKVVLHPFHVRDPSQRPPEHHPVEPRQRPRNLLVMPRDKLLHGASLPFGCLCFANQHPIGLEAPRAFGCGYAALW